MLMPHESTVNPFDSYGEDVTFIQSRKNTRGSHSFSMESGLAAGSGIGSSSSLNNQVTDQVVIQPTGGQLLNPVGENATLEGGRRPLTPSELTHHEDFDDDDDGGDSDESNKHSLTSTPPPV